MRISYPKMTKKTTTNMYVLRVRRWRSAELKKHQIWQRICRYFWHFHADVKKSARKGPINDSVEQLLSYPFPEISEITMQMIGKALEGSQKLTFCIFEKVVKYLHICCGILMIWKRDFRNFMISTQNVTIYALKGSVSWSLRKSMEFDPQNHQYSLGNIDVLSFSDSMKTLRN